MKKDELNDDLLEGLLPHGRMKMPFTDFFVFFILGTICGVVFTLWLPKLNWSGYGITTQDLVLPLLFILTIVFIICFENFMRLFKEYKN